MEIKSDNFKSGLDNAQGGAKKIRKMQKIAEKMQRFAKFCKKLQKNAHLFTTFPRVQRF